MGRERFLDAAGYLHDTRFMVATIGDPDFRCFINFKCGFFCRSKAIKIEGQNRNKSIRK